MANVNILENVGKATYDAAQLIFNRRYRAGLSMTSHYTLAHSRQGTLEPWNSSRSSGAIRSSSTCGTALS